MTLLVDRCSHKLMLSYKHIAMDLSAWPGNIKWLVSRAMIEGGAANGSFLAHRISFPN